MSSVILILTIILEAVAIVRAERGTFAIPCPLDLIIIAPLIAGCFAMTLGGNYLGMILMPRLGRVRLFPLFLIVFWLGRTLQGRFTEWIQAVGQVDRHSSLMANLLGILGVAIGDISILIVVIGALVLAIDGAISMFQFGGSLNLYSLFKPLIVVLGIGALSRIIGEFSFFLAR